MSAFNQPNEAPDDYRQHRLSAIATNAVQAAMECFGRTVQTDDDAARRELIRKLLDLKPTGPNEEKRPILPAVQVQPSKVTQSVFEKLLEIPGEDL